MSADVELDEFILKPFVGSIFNNSVLILFECKNRTSYELQIENLKRNYTVTNSIEAEGVTYIKISICYPESANYNVRFTRDGTIHYSLNVNYVRYPSRLVFCSHDRIDDEPSSTLWEEIPRYNPDICVHLGNNIYGDSSFAAAMNFARRFKEEVEETYNLALYKYSKKYIETFNRWIPYIGNCCNMFGIGEHEIYKDCYQLWDSYDMAERIVAKVALGTYDSYQGTTPELQKSPNSRFWVHTWVYENSNVCMAIFDRPLGTDQVLRLPTFYQIPSFTDYLILCAAFPPDSIEWKHFLDLLFAWRNMKPGRRVVIVSNTDSYSLKGTIYRSDGLKIQILITSPITKQPSSNGKEKIRHLRELVIPSDILNKDGEPLEYRYDIDETGIRRSFGIIDITKIDFHTSLVHSEHSYPSLSNILKKKTNRRNEKYK